MKKFIQYTAGFIAFISLVAFTAPVLKPVGGHSIRFSTFGASGIFKSFGGKIQFDANTPEASKFDVFVNVNSIKTSFALQDKHAKGEEWFDAAKYPTIRFVSKSIARNGAGYQATGDLTLRGITKEITIPFTYKPTATGGTFAGKFEINRNDFKVGEAGGMVGETIKLDIAIPVVK